MTAVRALGIRVDPLPAVASAAHAADAALLDAVAGRGYGLLRVHALAGDVVSLGRWHRRPPGVPGVVLHRRRGGARVAASGEGFAHVALYLPHRAALVGDDPAALAPEQILNRCVRGLLGGLEALGVPAVYPGRDLVTARGRALAVLGLEVDARGATLVDAVVSLACDQSLLPRLLERADPAGVMPAAMVLPDEVTSIARETGAAPGLADLAAAVRTALAARLGVTCVDDVAWSDGGEAASGAAGGPDTRDEPVAQEVPPGDEAWLDVRRVRPELDRRVRMPTALGTLEVDLALASDGTIADVQLSGDVVVPSAAMSRLEASLRGLPLDSERLHAAIVGALAPPHFLLGVHPLRRLADGIAAAG